MSCSIPKIYFVIPVFNRLHFTKECLKSIYSQSYIEFEVIVVDHGSTDNSTGYILENFPQVVVLQGDDSMWWSAATNVGIEYILKNMNIGESDYILTINNDLIIPENYLENIIIHAKKFPKALIGSITLDIEKPEVVCDCGYKWSNLWAKGRPAYPEVKKIKDLLFPQYEVMKSDLLNGRGLLIPIQCFKDIGLFDDKYFPHYQGDEDFSLRAKKAGYQLLICNNAFVYSYIFDSGLNLSDMNLKKFILSLYSKRSPTNLKIRWFWAIKHSPIGPFYFLIDVARIFGSSIRNMVFKSV